MLDRRERLKDFLVKLFVGISGNDIKGVTDEEMIQLMNRVRAEQDEELLKTLCQEVYSVATDPLQVAAQNLNCNL